MCTHESSTSSSRALQTDLPCIPRSTLPGSMLLPECSTARSRPPSRSTLLPGPIPCRSSSLGLGEGAGKLAKMSASHEMRAVR